MHHLHISGFALFCIALFLCVITAIILGFVQSIKADRRAAEVEIERAKRYGASARNYREAPEWARPSPIGPGSTAQANAAYTGSHAGPVYAAAPVVAPGYSGADVGLGLATGMILGSAMSHHHDTVIIDRGGYGSAGYVEPAYVSPSYDSGISYDSGPSDSGGGIDCSFGGGD
jgi:hypothetical protein